MATTRGIPFRFADLAKTPTTGFWLLREQSMAALGTAAGYRLRWGDDEYVRADGSGGGGGCSGGWFSL